MSPLTTQAIGNFLQYYESDLYYIQQFQRYKSGENTLCYTEKRKGSFYTFLTEFRVIRNFKEGKTQIILEKTIEWLNYNCNSNDVDSFALKLYETGITHNKIPVSMASKILFLNDPYNIIPMDRLARLTLNQKENNYSTYQKNLQQFKFEKKQEITKCLEIIMPLIKKINNSYGELPYLDKIAEQRIIDKILWVTGKSKL
ncbi:hypothetical protein [Flavobacterium coralii]|uniref:hypothetical protein n=1 Tax=Flavobacterium coralii TaxID=2838017 RepID=UPI000C532B9D|nr:hypothetical protein [Flavobacterium sp.]|tara:strand:- start:263 stop:862 length:600 start_codon:yes stop_codon:yes gene_type:complete